MLLLGAVLRRDVIPDAPPLSVTRPHAHRVAHDAPEDAVVDEAVICAGLVILACMMQENAASAVFLCDAILHMECHMQTLSSMQPSSASHG